ncbi:MAG: aspartate dehydrogenase [Geminicoccaceae bacterium]
MRKLKVGIGGLGAVGYTVARALDRSIPGLVLAAVSARDTGRAQQRIATLERQVPVVSLAELAPMADVVVECLPASEFRNIAVPAVSLGRIFMPLSIGQLLVHDDVLEIARSAGGRVIAPTGALLGLDAVRAAAEGEIVSVRMVTRKPPAGLQGAPYLEQNGIDVLKVAEPTKIFEGSAREGAKGFPANVNVAAALSLAGVGPDRTGLEIWADPTVDRNVHSITVEADSARFEMKIENVPSKENPRTGKITALSTIAALRGLVSTLRAGS